MAQEQMPHFVAYTHVTCLLCNGKDLQLGGPPPLDGSIQILHGEHDGSGGRQQNPFLEPVSVHDSNSTRLMHPGRAQWSVNEPAAAHAQWATQAAQACLFNPAVAAQPTGPPNARLACLSVQALLRCLQDSGPQTPWHMPHAQAVSKPDSRIRKTCLVAWLRRTVLQKLAAAVGGHGMRFPGPRVAAQEADHAAAHKAGARGGIHGACGSRASGQKTNMGRASSPDSGMEARLAASRTCADRRRHACGSRIQPAAAGQEMHSNTVRAGQQWRQPACTNPAAPGLPMRFSFSA